MTDRKLSDDQLKAAAVQIVELCDKLGLTGDDGLTAMHLAWAESAMRRMGTARALEYMRGALAHSEQDLPRASEALRQARLEGLEV